MRQLILMILLVSVNVSFSQYAFKYESDYTQLLEIKEKNQTSKEVKAIDANEIAADNSYCSKRYITN